MNEGKSYQDYIDEAQNYLEMKDKAEELKVTEQEINKVIAEFMGVPDRVKVPVTCHSLCDCDKCTGPDIFPGEYSMENPYRWSAPELRFTHSLDALVPVWFKLFKEPKCHADLIALHPYGELPEVRFEERESYEPNSSLHDSEEKTLHLAAAHATAKAILGLTNRTI